MTPEETRLLARQGSSLVLNLTECSVEVLFWGIHAILCVAALVSLGRRGLKRPSVQFLFAMLSGILVLNTFAAASFFSLLVQRIQAAFIHRLDLPLKERLNIVAAVLTSPLYRAYGYLASVSGLIFIFGDVVILWRAWTLWMGKKIFLVVPTFLLVASLAFSLTSYALALNIRSGPQANTSSFAITGIAAGACSIAANAVTTFMMGIQAYGHRKLMKDAFAAHTSRSWRILFFLTEAGVIYLVVQVVELALNLANTVPGSPLQYAFRVWIIFSRNVSATYLAIVLLIISYNRSLANDSGISGITDQLTDIETHISFGRQQGNPSTLRGTQSVDDELNPHQMIPRHASTVSDLVSEAGAANGDEEKNATYLEDYLRDPIAVMPPP